MVLLHYYLGSEGSGASNPRLRNVFGIGRGTAHLYRERCCKAISSLRDVAVYWPDIDERKAIAKRTNSQFGWPNCIGIADGTLFPLSSAPSSEDAPDYSGRKYGYSISCMVVCDDKRYIQHFLAGFPGSAHDSRVFNATHLAQNADDYFGDNYYLIGDSAFANTKFFVAAYKKPRGRVLTTEQEAFNTHLSKLRINSEHTIGILKARFPFLKKMALKVTDDPNSVRTVVR